MDLALVVADIEAKSFPQVNISAGGSYVVQRTYTHQGQEVGDFISHSSFYIYHGGIKTEIGKRTIEYTAPYDYVDEPILGEIPSSELELRRQQLTLCLEIARILSDKGIQTTITGKTVDEIQSIVTAWTEMGKFC
ncbi:MAG: hypothetical protein AABX82_09680 [Nanoarchaeota archaeon]